MSLAGAIIEDGEAELVLRTAVAPMEDGEVELVLRTAVAALGLTEGGDLVLSA